MKSLISLAKRNKITKLKVGDFEIELSPQAFLSKKTAKEMNKLIRTATEGDAYEEDLFYSS